MNEPTSIKEFDKETFDSIVERVILGAIDENGNSNPNVVRFILKTGEEYKDKNNGIDTSMSFGSYKRFSQKKMKLLKITQKSFLKDIALSFLIRKAIIFWSKISTKR